MAEKTSNIIIRTDSELKQQAEILFKELGMNMSMAINIFLKQSVREQSLPFAVTKKPNRRTMKAIKNSTKDKNLSKNFHSVEEMFEDLDH